ncbi:MAG: hypothetical protein Q6K99_03705, partial [Thermostichales cyanobacterium BF4_bins_65]
MLGRVMRALVGTALLFGSGLAGGIWVARSGRLEAWTGQVPGLTLVPQERTTSGVQALQTVNRDPIAPTGLNFVAEVAQQVGPAVVRINATRSLGPG